MAGPMAFNIAVPNKIIDIDSTLDAVLSFEAVGTITTGDIHFSVSGDGVTFVPVSFFSFVSSTMKPNLSVASGFVTEDRGSIDVLSKITARITSTPDFQGNVNMQVCEVPDAPTPKPPSNCCPSPTVFKSLVIKEGTQAAWVPNPSSSFILMGYSIGVTGDAVAGATPLGIRLLDAGADMGQNHYVALPSSPNVPVGEPLYTSPWIVLGDGQKSAAPNNQLQVALSEPLASGQVFVILNGREE